MTVQCKKTPAFGMFRQLIFLVDKIVTQCIMLMRLCIVLPFLFEYVKNSLLSFEEGYNVNILLKFCVSTYIISKVIANLVLAMNKK